MKCPGLVVILLAACGAAPPRDGAPPPPGAGRVVVISVDGLMPDAYLAPDAHGLAIPTLRSLVARGAATRVRGVMPTVTYPSHTTMVTGVPPRVHHIVTNKPLDPLGKNFDGWRWYAQDIAVPTLYQAVEAQHRAAALIVSVALGTHGWPPSDPAMAASFIAFGPRVPHVALEPIDMIDVAPTIARWLGVALPTATGKPIAGLVSPLPPAP